MPLTAAGEFFIRIIFDVVFYFFSYWTGCLVLNIISLGTLNLAPLDTHGSENKKKPGKFSIDWSIWLNQPYQKRALKAEFTSLVGLLVWFGIGIGCYLLFRD